MAARDRDVYFVFGSACKALAGKIPVKSWQAELTALWDWSVQTTQHYNRDVPIYEPPNGTPPSPSIVVPSTSTTLPPPSTNGSPDPDLPPPAEKPVKVADPAPIPTEQVVYLNDDQIVKFTAHAYKQGFSEMGLMYFLRSRGIQTTSQIPLGKAGLMWNDLNKPEIQAQYR